MMIKLMLCYVYQKRRRVCCKQVLDTVLPKGGGGGIIAGSHTCTVFRCLCGRGEGILDTEFYFALFLKIQGLPDETTLQFNVKLE